MGSLFVERDAFDVSVKCIFNALHTVDIFFIQLHCIGEEAETSETDISKSGQIIPKRWYLLGFMLLVFMEYFNIWRNKLICYLTKS